MALKLHSMGYDIWLGNTRGNKYSRLHKKLDPDAEINDGFWNFSFQEMGQYDLPAIFEFISLNQEFEKIILIAHS